MTTRGQNLRSSTPGQKPAAGTRLPGEIWMTWPDKQLGVIDASKTAQPMIAVRFFSTAANYASGDFVVQAGGIWVAKSAITAGAFNSTQWSELAYLTDIPALYVLPTASTTVLGGVKVDGVTVTISSGVISSAGLVTVAATAPSPVQNGALWYDLAGGQLYVWANDGTSSQWAVAVNQSISGVYLPLGGGTLAGPLILNADPTVALGAATKQYADKMLPLAGGAITGSMSVSATFSVGGTSNLNAINSGAIQAGGSVISTTGQFVAATGSGNPAFTLNNGAGSTGVLYWDAANGWVTLLYPGLGTIFIDGNGNFNVSGASAIKPGGGAWTAASDARIKTVEGEYKSGLDEILQLRPVAYAYKGNDTSNADVNAGGLSDPAGPKPKATQAPYPGSLHYQSAKAKRRFVGLIAQEVESVFPEMVTKRGGFIDGEAVSDLRDLDTGPLVFALINAVKKLSAEVNALKAQAKRAR